MATQEQRRESTRARLLQAATALFARNGYEATSTEAVLEAAGVSRGALYHHFETKQELFAAVFESVSRSAVERSAARVRPGQSPLEALIEGCLAWLREARKPQVAAILLDQGPPVLGWQRAREIEYRFSLGVMRASVQNAVDAGELEVASVELTSSLINAALAEAALAALHSHGRISAKTVERSIRQLIEGLAVR